MKRQFKIIHIAESGDWALVQTEQEVKGTPVANTITGWMKLTNKEVAKGDTFEYSGEVIVDTATNKDNSTFVRLRLQ